MTINIEDVKSINDFVEKVRTINDHSIDNLPQFTKPCIITSPTFVHESIANEQIMINLYDNLYNMYTGYILTALRLESAVSGSKTVRDILSGVSSNQMISSYEDLNGIHKRFISGSIEEKTQFIEYRGKERFPTGRIIEVELSPSNPETKKEKLSVNLFIQLTPRFITDHVLEQFLATKIDLGIKKRWFQYKAEEITFWKDFVFQIDRLNKLSKSLSEDNSNSLREMLRNHNKSVFQRLLKFIALNKSHNVSNKIFIVEENKMKKYCNNIGLRIDKFPDRQKMFNRLYGMIIVLINPMYNNVTMYVNSFNTPVQLTYNQLKNSSFSDKLSLMDVMNAMSQNKMPSF